MIVDVTLSKKKPAKVPVRAVVRQETQKVIHIQVPVKVAGSKKTAVTHIEPKRVPEPVAPPAEVHVTPAAEPAAKPAPEPDIYTAYKELFVPPEPVVAPQPPQPQKSESDEPFFFFEERPIEHHTSVAPKETPIIAPTPMHDEFFDKEEDELDFFEFNPDEIPSSHIEEDYRESISQLLEELEVNTFTPREPVVTEYIPTHDWEEDESDFHKAESIDELIDYYQPEEAAPVEEEETVFEEPEAEQTEEDVLTEEASEVEQVEASDTELSELDEFFLEDNDFDAFVMFSEEPEEELSDEGFVSFDDEAQDGISQEDEEEYILDESNESSSDEESDEFILESSEANPSEDEPEEEYIPFDAETMIENEPSEEDEEYILIEEEDALDDQFGEGYTVLEIEELEDFESAGESYGSAELLPPVDEHEGITESELEHMNEADSIFERFGILHESEKDEPAETADDSDPDPSQVKFFTRDEHGDQVETSREDATEIVCYNEESGKPSRYFGVKKNSNPEQ